MPKTSSIRPSFLIEHRLVVDTDKTQTDRQTQRHSVYLASVELSIGWVDLCVALG